jgi:molybdopterin-guanine dinucleotide biosynthesis protein A
VISLLIRLVPGNDAVVPRWPNGYIEPLQAIYRTKEAYRASLESIASEEFRLVNLISRLKEVLYLSTTVIKQLDKELLTFHNINVFNDLETIMSLLKTT